MTDITVLVNEVLNVHIESVTSGNCVCGGEFPCPEQRIAADWKRQHEDLCRAWKNRTGKEVFLVRKFACAVCSEKDTGLVCGECIANAAMDDNLQHKEDMVGMEMALEAARDE
jgi:hypothetical protein